MILRDIGRNPEAALNKINRHLHANYGFVITETADRGQLANIADRIKEEIRQLKINGHCVINSPAITQRLLILEGIKTLQESFKSPDFDILVEQMAHSVVEYLRRTSAEDNPENFEDAMRDVMRLYRSSEYLFPDNIVENAIRECALSRLGSVSHAPMDTLPDTHNIDNKEDNMMFEKENMIRRIRTLLESQVSQAEVMMAAKGFAQELQEMVEKVGRLQNEDLPPVTDQMRETYDTSSASAFQTLVYSAMQNVMDALYTAKGQIDDAVENMATTGQVSAETDMDREITTGDELATGDELPDTPTVDDLDNIAADELEDEFGGAEEEEPLGRSAKNESVERLEQRVNEMRRLVQEAKRLKERK